MISIRPDYLKSTSRPTPEIRVELDGDGYVDLVIEADAGETFDDRDMTRPLSPDEARAVAAMLWHFAEQAER